MRILSVRQRVRRAGVGALLGACAALFAACGVTPTVRSQPGQVTLTCTTTSSAQGVDVVSTLLTCDVRNAPASDTSFMLEYSVATSTGQAHLFTPVCAGPLSDGNGSCVQRYSAPVPLALGKGIVSGKTSPDQRPLGPVTPQQGVAQTPPPGGPLPPVPPLG